MSELPKCKLCGGFAEKLKDGRVEHEHFGPWCPLRKSDHMTEVDWRALMTQQAGDSTDQLRFKSACEISGEKHPEYVRGYEAAMDAVCNSKQAWEPVEYQFYDPATGKWHNFINDQHRRNTADAGYEIRALCAAPQAQPDGEIVVTWDESQTTIIAVTRQDAEGKVLSVIAEAQSEEYRIPCDVKLPPNTRFSRGCRLSTVIAGMEMRRNGIEGISMAKAQRFPAADEENDEHEDEEE